MELDTDLHDLCFILVRCDEKDDKRKTLPYIFLLTNKTIKVNDREYKLNAKTFILFIDKLCLKVWGPYNFTLRLGQGTELSKQNKENYSSMKVTSGISTTVQLLSVCPSALWYTRHASSDRLLSASIT